MQLGRIASCVTHIATLVFVSISSLAQKVSPRERVEQIANAASLVREGTAPWHLRMAFQLYDLSGKPAETGTIEEWWASPTSHRLVVTTPSYNFSIPGDGDESAGHRRENYLVDLLLKQVIDPIPHYGDFKNLKVTEAKRKFGNVELTCYGIERSDLPASTPAPPSKPEYCVDEGHDDLRIRFDMGYFAAVRNHIGRFRNIELGVEDSLTYSGRQAISGKIETLESYDPAKLPVELTHASDGPPAIPGIVLAGKIRKKEQPVYPFEAKQKHLGGTVILTAIISKQGTISSLEVVASPDESLSRASVDAVKHWTYDPYLLNGQPTEVDTTITVNFNIN